jgi:hypothetical protein
LGAPIVNRREDVAGSNGEAGATTLRTRARTSAIGAASFRRAVRRNDALRRSQEQRIVEEASEPAKPVADGRRREVQSIRRPADMPLRQDGFEHDEQVEVEAREIDLVQHRHADPLVDAVSLEQAAALARGERP